MTENDKRLLLALLVHMEKELNNWFLPELDMKQAKRLGKRTKHVYSTLMDEWGFELTA